MLVLRSDKFLDRNNQLTHTHYSAAFFLQLIVQLSNNYCENPETRKCTLARVTDVDISWAFTKTVTTSRVIRNG